jgi:hypothetical protein
LSRRDNPEPQSPLRVNHTATMMPMPRRQILILIVAHFSSRLPRYTVELIADRRQLEPV